MVDVVVFLAEHELDGEGPVTVDLDCISRIEEEIESVRKTRRRKLRAKIGTKKRRCQDVDEGTGAF